MRTARHTSAHTSTQDGAVFRDSRKAREIGHPLKASLPSSIHKVLRLSNNKKSGLSKLPREAARSNNSLRFSRRFGSGSRSRFVTTAIDGYRKSSEIPPLCVRVGPDRQMLDWSVSNSNNRQTAARSSRPRVTKRSSALCRAALSVLFGSLTSKSFHLSTRLTRCETRADIYKPQERFCQ
jgi:hypothetical protein